MRIFPLITAGIVAMLCQYGQLMAQTKVWTLKECIDYALQHNIQVKQAGLNVESSKAVHTRNVGALFPTLNGNATQGYNYGRSIDPFTNQFVQTEIRSNNFSLSSSMPLFQGFQNVNSVRQSAYDTDASKEDLAKQQNDIALNVVTAYLQILYNKELVVNAKDRFNTSQANLERTKKLVESGRLPKGSQLQAEAQLANDELSLVNQQNQLDLSHLTLVQLLDRKDFGDFAVEYPDLPLPTEELLNSSPNTIYEYALKNQPEIKSSELKLRSADIGLQIARGGRLPRLFLNAQVGSLYSNQAKLYTLQNVGRIPIGLTEDNKPVTTINDQYLTLPSGVVPFNDQLDNNFSQSVALSLSVPLLNGWQINSNIKRSKINMMSSQLNLDLAKSQLYKTIQQAHSDAVAALKRYNSAQKTVSAQKEALSYMEQKFNVGVASSIEYQTARNDLSKAQADNSQAKFDFIFRLKVLDYYSGKPLSF